MIYKVTHQQFQDQMESIECPESEIMSHNNESYDESYLFIEWKSESSIQVMSMINSNSDYFSDKIKITKIFSMTS